MLSLQISFIETCVWSAFYAHLHAIKYKLHKYYIRGLQHMYIESDRSVENIFHWDIK